MIYQLTWKILPGLRGLSCSDFHATPTAAPNTEQGVAIDCASERDRDALLQVRLEDAVAAEDIFSTLMGENVEQRRKFIEDNALDVVNLDI